MTVTLLVAIFTLGYLAITLEHAIKVNKSASALVTGVVCWTVCVMLAPDREPVLQALEQQFADIAGILFFLLGAMVIVELIDAHNGFDSLGVLFRTRHKVKLLWGASLVTFFLSALLDNLTTTIVMVTLMRRLIPSRDDRLIFAGMTVIAANAGGAWSPLGDVTTTMLWIGKQITPATTITTLILPSLACLIAPLALLSLTTKGELLPAAPQEKHSIAPGWERTLVLSLGFGALIAVPIFKTVTHLPPFMGMLLGLGGMWLLTELVHGEKDDADHGVLSVNHALRKIDAPSILFFLGILLAVSALEAAGVLTAASTWLQARIQSLAVVSLLIGLLSAVVDNVPLVAAMQGMFPLEQFPTDHVFWQFLTYCSGTGGSALIIGSAAGVAAMGIEKIDFFLYMKRVTGLALLGYAAGAAVFIAQRGALF
jgi:Na+/H+ antiporter NhaD/arsenite permease-like protein